MPRNGVLWPTLPAVVTHDAQCVAAGITTVLDALSVGDLEGDSVRLDTLQSAFDAIDAGMRQRVFRAEHLFHLRCELAYPTLLDALAPLLDHPAVRLVSLMNTPRPTPVPRPGAIPQVLRKEERQLERRYLPRRGGAAQAQAAAVRRTPSPGGGGTGARARHRAGQP